MGHIITRYDFLMSDYVGIKHHGHVVIQNCNLVFAEESKILDNYIKLGQPSNCCVMLSIACFAGRGMPSLIAMLLMYMYMYTI